MLPGVLETAYLNTGTCGPLPTISYEAMCAELAKDLTCARIDSTHFPHMFDMWNDARDAIAGALGADASEIALTNRTTDGMFVSIMGYRWLPKEELIISNIEHPGGLIPAFLAKKKYGIRVKVADIGLGGGDPADIVRTFEELITPRTRMIAISHISYTTGATLPVKEIVEMAHSHDVLVSVDAAQSYGSMQLDMHDLGVDFYACPGQKWMCGPDGTGALYVRASSMGELEQNHGGMLEWGSLDYYGGSFQAARDASRYDTGGWNTGLLAGQITSTNWIVNELGLDWVSDRISTIADYTYSQLSALPGVEIVTPREAITGLIAFNVDGQDPIELADRLAAEHNVTIRYVTKYINNPDAARVSVGFYNTVEDIDRMIEGIQAIQASPVVEGAELASAAGD